MKHLNIKKTIVLFLKMYLIFNNIQLGLSLFDCMKKNHLKGFKIS